MNGFAPLVMVSFKGQKEKTGGPPVHQLGWNAPSLDPSYNFLDNTFQII
jgi:hypothetical protein